MKKILSLLTLPFLATSALHAQDAAKIIEGARMAATLVEIEEGLQGNLVQGRTRVPLTLFLRGENIQFAFPNQAHGAFHMRLADDKYDLFEMRDGRTIAFPPAKLTESIAGTDLTFEDLALRFFYWPNPVLEGTENVNGQPCYKIRLNKPRGAAGLYEAVYVWVHTRYGAFMQIRGHDANGGLVKEFQVKKVMQISKDVWTLEQMQVSTHDPRNDRRLSITNVNFNAPKKVNLRGLR